MAEALRGIVDVTAYELYMKYVTDTARSIDIEIEKEGMEWGY